MAYEGPMPPSNPKDGDTYDYHGYVYTYIADKDVWKLSSQPPGSNFCGV